MWFFSMQLNNAWQLTSKISQEQPKYFSFVEIFNIAEKCSNYLKCTVTSKICKVVAEAYSIMISAENEIFIIYSLFIETHKIF